MSGKRGAAVCTTLFRDCSADEDKPAEDFALRYDGEGGKNYKFHFKGARK